MYNKVAGRTFKETLNPEPNLVHTFVWDGVDAYGRKVHGKPEVKGN